MGGGTTGNSADHDDGAADFLRRLSVADAKVLLERTRTEKEAKTKEMQKMIGVRYRDLIDSADKIVSMHSAAMRLETSLKEMPEKWKQMESTLASTLASSDKHLPSSSNGSIDHHHDKEASSTLDTFATVHERVLFIVTSHEQLWFHLDRGESSQALGLYHRAKAIYDSPEIQEAITTYPFLPAMWASVHSFEHRVKQVAEVCLIARGRNARFYADNLDALASLGRAQGVNDLVAIFLESRAKWLVVQDSSLGDDDESSDPLVAAERQMRLNLRSLLVTILHAQDIFLIPGDASATSTLRKRFASELADPTTVNAMTRTTELWFDARMEEVSSHVSSIVKRIPTIARIAQIQSKLTKIETRYATYRATTLWKKLHRENVSSTTNASMFGRLFGSALRKRTRDLVQHSFVDATTAIKNEVRSCLSSMSTSSKGVNRLPCIKFYDYFDLIHKKVAGLDFSELQRVLTEEYMRTLFGFVHFLETEYPLVDQSEAEASNPSYLLGLANILTSIVSLFPSRQKAVFGDSTASTTSTTTASVNATSDRDLFEATASRGRLSKSALLDVLKHAHQQDPVSSFMDDEVAQTETFGFFTFHLVSQIRAKTPYADVFVGVLRGLAEKYCEAWARHLLQQKIAPLRGFVQVEQYDLTNEEWIASHQGWSEQIIVDDGFSGDDESDGLPAGDEKVWLPWCETPTVSSFLFSCCYALDEAYRLVRTAKEVSPGHVTAMHELIRSVLTEQLTIMSVDVYEGAVDLVVEAKRAQGRSVLNFGEYCMLQFLFDMYFVRATLGFSDFIRFGWGDDIDLATCTPSVARLKKLFDRMHDFIDPVDWEIYGPQLIENVVIQFRKSRLLFSSLSEANDIHEINGKPIIVSAQDTRPIIKLAEPVPRFSLLPVPSTRRRAARDTQSVNSSTSSTPTASRTSSGKGDSLFQESGAADTSAASASLSSLKLQDLLSTTTGSNILSAAASGTNLLSSAAKGMSFLSSATSSYLREGATSNGDANRSKYF